MSSGREAQLVPKGIGQLLMEALGMSAARPIHGREKKTGPVGRLTRFAKPRPTRKTFRDVEQAPSFHREPASLIERRNERCERAPSFLNNGPRHSSGANVAKTLRKYFTHCGREVSVQYGLSKCKLYVTDQR